MSSDAEGFFGAAAAVPDLPAETAPDAVPCLSMVFFAAGSLRLTISTVPGSRLLGKMADSVEQPSRTRTAAAAAMIRPQRILFTFPPEAQRSHFLPAKKMHMQMRDFLPAVPADIDNEPVAVCGNSFLCG